MGITGAVGEMLEQLVAGMRGGVDEREFRAGIEAGQRMLGNRVFMHWVGELQCGEQEAAPLQLMGKKKKRQAAPDKPGSEAVPDSAGKTAGAGKVEGEGAAPEGEKKPGAGDPLPQPGAQAAALPVEKKKKKSRVQVALNTLRGEGGVAAFGKYVDAEIGEAALLRILVERINRAADLGDVRKAALGIVEGRLEEPDPAAGAGKPGTLVPAQDQPPGLRPQRQGWEEPEIAPVKSEFSRREMELFGACIKGEVGRFRRFLRHGNVDTNMADKFGTLLCHAAYNGNTAIVRELLLIADIDVNLAQQAGATPLYLAAQWGHVKVVELLLSVPGINANLATNMGVTPLHVAAQKGYLEVVRMLLAARGINVNPVIHDKHTTPLHLAIYMGHEDVAGLILEAPDIDVDQQDEGGLTAVHFAAEYNLPGVAGQLVRRGADVNLTLSLGVTPLFIAARSGHLEVVRALLHAPGVRINQVTGGRYVALGIAAQMGHKDIVKLLLRKGADPNVQSGTGLTPLHVACLHGYTAIVQMLLHAGADADAKVDDPEGEGLTQTPYGLAELGGQWEVMFVLAAHRRRKQEAPRRLERSSITEMSGQDTGTPSPLSGKETEGETDAVTADVSPAPPTPVLPDEGSHETKPPAPLAQAKDGLRQEVLGRLRADNLDPHTGIRLLIDVNATDSIDALCVLYNRLAHIERIKERARRRIRRREELPVPAGAVPAAADPAAAPEFALDGNTGLDAERVEVEIKRHLGQKYHRFVSQAVNDMEFGRGKPTTGHRELWHVSAGIPGVGSCSVFYYLDAARNRIRIVGIGRHVGRAAYQLDYAAGELGGEGRVLRLS